MWLQPTEGINRLHHRSRTEVFISAVACQTRPRRSRNQKKKKKKKTKCSAFVFFWCAVMLNLITAWPEARFCSSWWKLIGCVDGLKFVKVRHQSSPATLSAIHALLFQKIYFKTRDTMGGVWAGFFFSSCATKRALKSAGFVFIPCLEVSAPWLWMANYHRANGSRLSLLLVTWLYSSGVFFSPSLSFITRDDNGGFSVGETFFRIPPRS